MGHETLFAMNDAPENIRRVTVYASSSSGLAREYYDAAERLGAVLGRAGLEIVYGGGGVGLMGAMAEGALAEGAHVHGVIPGFLNTVEHGHQNLPRLEVVSDMRERKERMIDGSNAVISLPGGSGTLEELFEVITLKRLGQFLGPILLLNTNCYYGKLEAFMSNAVSERFMADRHLEMWSLVDEPEDVLQAMWDAAEWSADARSFAAVRS
jgi:uncharacterized protein (TIGR00730 family)